MYGYLWKPQGFNWGENLNVPTLKDKNDVIVTSPIFKNTYDQQSCSMAGKLVSLTKTQYGASLTIT